MIPLFNSGKVFKNKKQRTKSIFYRRQVVVLRLYRMPLNKLAQAECLMAQTHPFRYWRISGKSVNCCAISASTSCICAADHDRPCPQQLKVTPPVCFLKWTWWPGEPAAAQHALAVILRPRVPQSMDYCNPENFSKLINLVN